MEICTMVCKLVKGLECFNGLVNGTVIIHPWSVESSENLSRVRGAHRCFPSHWSYQSSPLAVFSPLWSTTKDKWFCAPFGLDCGCVGPQFVLKETQFLASLVMQALSSRITFCLLSPFFFFHDASAFSIISSQWARRKIKNLPKHSSRLFFSK